MAEPLTLEELAALYPLGAVNVQHDDDVRPMTEPEWTKWLEALQAAEPFPPTS